MIRHPEVPSPRPAPLRGLKKRQCIQPSPTGDPRVDRIREDFPILALQVYGKPLVYLDNAASAQKPNAVLDRMTEAYRTEYANVHRGLHYLANAATEAYEGGRAKVATFLNAARAEEIVFTRNATEAINLVASSWGEPNIKAGDEIVLSIMEHHSNIVPWHFLRERHGAVIKWADVDDDGNFLIDEFEKLLTDRTRLVAITQMSNALGTIVPVKEVKRAHARGIPGAGRRRGAPCIRCRRAGHRLRFHCVATATSPMARPGSACSTAKNARTRRHAAIQRWRRDDPRSVAGCHHLWRSAAQIRGGDAGDRGGGSASAPR